VGSIIAGVVISDSKSGSEFMAGRKLCDVSLSCKAFYKSGLFCNGAGSLAKTTLLEVVNRRLLYCAFALGLIAAVGYTHGV
jgi:hypothetical protein